MKKDQSSWGGANPNHPDFDQRLRHPRLLPGQGYPMGSVAELNMNEVLLNPNFLSLRNINLLNLSVVLVVRTNPNVSVDACDGFARGHGAIQIRPHVTITKACVIKAKSFAFYIPCKAPRATGYGRSPTHFAAVHPITIARPPQPINPGPPDGGSPTG